MYNMLKEGCEDMLFKHLHEQVKKEITKAQNRQAAAHERIAANHANFDKEWNTWTTSKKIKRLKKNKP